MTDIENSKYYEIHLNSLFRNRGSLSSPVYVISPARHMDYFKVKNVSIPLTWYTINGGNNKVLFIEEPVDPDPEVVRSATVPQGNYNADTYATALASAMTSSGTQTYTATVNEANQKITITAPTTRYKLRFNATTGTSNRIIGFSDLKTDTAFALSITGDRPLSLNSTEAVYVVSHTLQTQAVVPGYQSSVLCKVILTSPQNSWQQTSFADCSFDITASDTMVSELDLHIIDADNLKELDLNGHAWSMTLSAWT